MHHHHRTVLGDLPDSCLLQVFKNLSPLPDKFSVGATCWRFWRLVSDKRLWLVVSPTGSAQESAPGGAGPVYTTLAAAVQASRPGDTIWLSPGVTHTAADVDVPWPLHILGGGAHPSETWLAAPQHADCALHFTASAKVAQLSVSSTLCPCIIHKRGSLTVQNCLLASEPKGLHHLVSPVLTLAVSTAAAAAAPGPAAAPAAAAAAAAAARARIVTPPPPSETAAAAAFVVVQQDTPATVVHGICDKQPVAAAATLGAARPAVNSSSSSVMLCRPPACIGPGKLQVVECQLMGGSTAVRCGGTGHLRNVRAIYESHSKAPYFWLEVDSADGPAASVSATAGVGAAAGVGGSLWEAAAGAYLQQHRQELAAAAAAGEGDGDADASDTLLLQQRSKAWQQRQAVLLPAAAVGGGGPGCPSSGLARIHAVLGGRSINPVSLAAHLTAKQQQQDGGH